MKKLEAKKLTIKIMAIVLEDQNGYSKEEIKTNKLAEECEGSLLFENIQKLLVQTK